MRTINLPPSGAHAAPVTHVTLRPDARRLATSSYDGTVLIWDITTPSGSSPIAELRHRRLVNGAAWHPHDGALIATASADKTAAVWHVPDDGRPELRTVLAHHTDDVNSVAWLPDGRHLVCVSEDGRATLWEAMRGVYLGEVGRHTAHCMMVSISVDGLIATVGEDGMVAVGRPFGTSRVTRHYDSSVEGCAWSHSGRELAVARDDGRVDILSATLGTLRSIEVATSATRSVAWSDDDRTIVVGAYDGSLHVFDNAGTRLRRVHDHSMWPRSVSVARGIVAVGSFGAGPHLVDLAGGSWLAPPPAPTHGPNALAVQHGDLLVGCDSGTVLAVDTAVGPDPAVRVIGTTDRPVLSLAVHGGAVFAGTYGGEVVRLEPERSTTGSLGAPVTSLCTSGGRLVAGTYHGELLEIDPGTMRVVDRGTPHGGSVKSLAPLRGGFVSASTDRTVAAGSLRQRGPVLHHGNLVNAVAVLDDRVVASASRDHSVQVAMLGDERDGPPRVRSRQTLLGPDESVKAVAVLGDPAAPLVLAGSYDFGLYAWQVDWSDSAGALRSGRQVDGFDQGISCMTATGPDTVAVAGWDGQIKIVRVTRGGTVEMVQTHHVGDLVRRSAAAREEVSS